MGRGSRSLAYARPVVEGPLGSPFEELREIEALVQFLTVAVNGHVFLDPEENEGHRHLAQDADFVRLFEEALPSFVVSDLPSDKRKPVNSEANNGYRLESFTLSSTLIHFKRFRRTPSIF